MVKAFMWGNEGATTPVAAALGNPVFLMILPPCEGGITAHITS